MGHYLSQVYCIITCDKAFFRENEIAVDFI